jgi:hypothetical protein
MPEPTAIVGAVTGLLGLTLSLAQEFRYRRADRPVVRVRAEFDGREAWLRAVNAGKVTVELRSVHARMREKPDQELRFRTSPPVPRTLSLGEDVFLDVDIARLGAGVTGFYVLDAVGKRWPLPADDFERLVKAREEAMRAVATDSGSQR